MRKGFLTAVAMAALSVPAVAQQQGGVSGQSGQQQTESQSGTLLGSSQALAGHQISPQQLNTSQVREIQQALEDRGERSVRVNGEWGPETEAALKNFQKSENMTAQTGEVDASTLAALGLDPSSFGLAGITETTGEAPRGGTSQQPRTQGTPEQTIPHSGGRQAR
jgi:peptidoglycan hydrolase-like protein with peptidoglycan-binding domain